MNCPSKTQLREVIGSYKARSHHLQGWNRAQPPPELLWNEDQALREQYCNVELWGGRDI